MIPASRYNLATLSKEDKTKAQWLNGRGGFNFGGDKPVVIAKPARANVGRVALKFLNWILSL